MNKAKFFLSFVIICVALLFFGAINPTVAADKSPTGTTEIAYNTNPFERTVVQLLLAIGDFLVDRISAIVGEDVSVKGLVFNEVEAVNPNFFDDHNAGLAHVDVKDAVTKWYTFFRRFAVILYIICIMSIGIRMLADSTPKGLTTARAQAIEWLKGIIYLLMIPFVIYMLFRLNEALVNMVRKDGNYKGYAVGSALSDGTDWSAIAIDFRSPAYVSKYTGVMTYGGSKANEYYLSKVNDYSSNLDLMRIARAYAGATFKMGYVFIWYVLIGQLITFIYIYYKRYFMISFFIAIFPVVCMFQAIGIMKDGSSRADSSWLSEIISHIFTQFIHAVIFVIITGFVTNMIQMDIQNGNLVNWVLAIMGINFIPEGEKILRKILKAISTGSSTEGIGGGGLKKGFNSIKQGFKQVTAPTAGKPPSK